MCLGLSLKCTLFHSLTKRLGDIRIPVKISLMKFLLKFFQLFSYSFLCMFVRTDTDILTGGPQRCARTQQRARQCLSTYIEEIFWILEEGKDT